MKISGIGQAKEAALASYGIETAADVEIGKVLSVPGFGPVNSRPLIEWRDELAKKFNYDPNPNAVDQAVLSKIRAEITRKAAQLRQELTAAAKELGKPSMPASRYARTPIHCFRGWKRRGPKSKRIFLSSVFHNRHGLNLGDRTRHLLSSFLRVQGTRRPV